MLTNFKPLLICCTYFPLLGITPKLTNEVGLNLDNARILDGQHPRSAVQKSLSGKSTRQMIKQDPNGGKEIQLAYPNDRAASIRPCDRTKTVK